MNGDMADERIRVLVAQAVASAPAPPLVDEVRAPGQSPVPITLVRTARVGRPGWGPMLRAVAASIAIVALALAGARAVGGLGGAGQSGDAAALPGGGLPVRYVPAVVPDGLRLASVETGEDAAPAPVPAVAVYESDEVTVRIAVGPTDWATRASAAATAPPPTVPAGGPTTTQPPTTAPATSGPDTTGSTTTTTPTTSTTAPGADTTTVPGTGTTTDTAPPTTTVPLDAASLPSVPGIPGRPDIRATTVRGDVGGIETHGPDASTVWFLHQGQLVAVDIHGLGEGEALGVVERLAPGRAASSAGDLVPAGEDGLRLAADAPARPAGTALPAAVRLVYAHDDTAGGEPPLEVTTTALVAGHDDLLTAAIGTFGRIERWGDRRVLVDDGLDGGATTLVSFVDSEAGVLVTVRGPSDGIDEYVDSLEAAGDLAWAQFLAENPQAAGPVEPDSQVETNDGGSSPVPTTAYVATTGPPGTAEAPPEGA